MFMGLNQENLAVFIIYKTRFDSNFIEVWIWAIEEYTQIKVQTAKEIVNEMTILIQRISKEGPSLLLPLTPRRITGISNMVY